MKDRIDKERKKVEMRTYRRRIKAVYHNLKLTEREFGSLVEGG